MEIMLYAILKVNSDELRIIEDFEPPLPLEEMQEIVGGYIDALSLVQLTPGRTITVWFNDEGKINGLPANFALMDASRNLLDIVMGDVLFTATDEVGETVGLTYEEIEWIEQHLDFDSGILSPILVTKTLYI